MATLKHVFLTLWKNLEFYNFFSVDHFWQTSNLFICIFLLILGIFITMLQISGGAYAYSVFAKRKVKSRKSAETASLILSSGLFVDDYLSCLTTGAVMYPLTDTQKVPRAKLAFLVDSMSGSLAILCPFSSWVAAIVGFLGDNGISETINKSTLIVANPFTTFVNIIPFLFYSFILIASMWFIVRSRISFGLMKKFEDIAHSTGNLFGGHRAVADKEKNIEHNPQHTTLLEFFFPIVVLLVSVLGGILHSGGWWLLGGHNSITGAFQQASAAAGLFVGGDITLVVCTIFFVLRKRITIRQLPMVYWDGIKLMWSASVVLILAWTFGDLLRNQLHTGEYLANMMLNSVNITALPMIIFFAGCIIAFTIGSAWGTAAMMFPIVIPLVLSMINAPHHPTLTQIPILFPVLGALLSGCVAGNHVSPIADTTIMSCLSTHTTLEDHVHTQLQYALPGIIITGFAFLLSGILVPYGLLITICVPLAAAITLNMLTLKFLSNKAHSK
ncbi:MAG TPA: Na+/H+ antiporter NhaC family protein [Gammaproteobacteria bacterium]|nr:Na+/H+ antiporter NhaC family protein [Gammaproteobacteria bacterium]